LLNRAFNGRYAPGSTIKGPMALAALAAGISASEVLTCPGWYSLPNSKHRYRCWKKPGHGKMDLSDAIIQSCDVYFYKRAREMGIQHMHDFLTDFGLGAQTKVDLGGEPSGLIPSPEWKRRAQSQTWFPGETVITGIGQGYMLVTPLQLATMAATLANRGVQVQPRMVRATRAPSARAVSKVEQHARRVADGVNTNHFDYIVDAMVNVVHGKRGTARAIGKNIPYQIAGKTGTAQVVGIKQNEKYDADKLDRKFHDHALFVAFAPAEAPRIAVAVIAENGGSGSRTAAPIAKVVIDYYLREILNLYPDFYEYSEDVNT
jgi:penicillin-binding protein 2